MVMCELVWVFESAYRYEKPLISELIERMLITTEFMIESSLLVRAALKEFAAGSADFSDCLIQHSNRERGCQYTITFDRKAAKNSFGRLLTSD